MQVLNVVPLIAAVRKCVLVVKENVTPLLTTNDNHVKYHLVIIDIEAIKCRASYVSSTHIDRLKKIYQKIIQVDRNNNEFCK